jgi:hypothetical protein
MITIQEWEGWHSFVNVGWATGARGQSQPTLNSAWTVLLAVCLIFNQRVS